MTKIVAGVVDVVVIRRVGRTPTASHAPHAPTTPTAWRVLTLERAPGVRSTGAWEIVHGSIEPGEPPVQAALRELREETGLVPEQLYSITVNPFYLAGTDTIQLAVAFAAVVTSTKFTLGPEHTRAKWETFAAATKRLAWPRTRELLRHLAWILRTGNAGALEGVLRAK